jgi:hypothetical protein
VVVNVGEFVSMGAERFKVFVSESATVEEVLAELNKEHNFHARPQALVFRGKKLPNSARLPHVGVKHGSYLLLAPPALYPLAQLRRLPAQSGAGGAPADDQSYKAVLRANKKALKAKNKARRREMATIKERNKAIAAEQQRAAAARKRWGIALFQRKQEKKACRAAECAAAEAASRVVVAHEAVVPYSLPMAPAPTGIARMAPAFHTAQWTSTGPYGLHQHHHTMASLLTDTLRPTETLCLMGTVITGAAHRHARPHSGAR